MVLINLPNRRQVSREIEVIWRVKPCNLGDTHGCLGVT